MKLVIFEDSQFTKFLPLAWTRGVFEFRCGATTLAEKLERATGQSPDAYITRDYLEGVLKQRLESVALNDLSATRGEEVLCINARVCGTGLRVPTDRVALWHGEQLRAVAHNRGCVGRARLRRTDGSGPERGSRRVRRQVVRVHLGLDAGQSARDRGRFQGRRPPGHRKVKCIQVRSSSVRKTSSTSVPEPRFTRWSAWTRAKGPITIEAGCEIHPFTRVEGPCYVGHKSILLGAKVREGCSIGPMCRVGGEVEESIIHGHSNKYHDGFLGHAYVGEWVNLGALTTNSDLKNDYSSVSVIQNGKTIDTGSTKVGSFIGDHVKTSIGTLLNTGSIVGTAAILLATGSPLPKSIPAFAWFLNGMVGKGFGLKPILETAGIAMSRRKREFTAEDEKLLRHVFELTADERNTQVRRSRKTLASR